MLGLEQEIACKVQQRIEGQQRQLLLHEKLRVIRDEIEEAGDETDEDVAEYARRAAAKQLSPAARKLVTRELRKLKQAPPMSPEVAVIRGLLDTVLDLPWGELAPAEVDVPAVARHLERTHYGLKDVKDRILEYLAVCRMRADAARGRRGPEAPRPARPRTSRPPSSAWPALPAPARAAWRRASPTRSGGPSCAWPSAACATRPRSAGIAAPTSARCPGASSRASPRPASTTPSCCSTRSTSSTATGAATRRRRSWRSSTRRTTTRSATTTSSASTTSAACSSSPRPTTPTPSRTRSTTASRSST